MKNDKNLALLSEAAGGRMQMWLALLCFYLKCCNNNCHKLNSCHDLQVGEGGGAVRLGLGLWSIRLPDRCNLVEVQSIKPSAD